MLLRIHARPKTRFVQLESTSLRELRAAAERLFSSLYARAALHFHGCE